MDPNFDELVLSQFLEMVESSMHGMMGGTVEYGAFAQKCFRRSLTYVRRRKEVHGKGRGSPANLNGGTKMTSFWVCAKHRVL